MDVSQISTGNPTIDRWIGLIGTFVTVSSFFAGFLNQKVRETMESEGEVPKFFLFIALSLNYCAVNLDKSVQMHRLLRGQKISRTNRRASDRASENTSEESKP